MVSSHSCQTLRVSVSVYATTCVSQRWQQLQHDKVRHKFQFQLSDIGVEALPGCHALIYPGAFNMTTGPLHWELLQRARYVTIWTKFRDYSSFNQRDRAVDNQVFFSMCSPARDLSANYHAVSFSHDINKVAF